MLIPVRLRPEVFEGRKSCRIARFKQNCDLVDKSAWPQYHQWLIDMLGRFERVFRPRVRSIDPDQWQADGPEEDLASEEASTAEHE